MSEENDALAPGTVFGRYVITRLLGRGGMGSVYEAEHVQLRKRVALKTLHPEHARREGARERFLKEGEAAARIHHPNVVDVTDVGVEADIPYLVMEYLDGRDLAAYIGDRVRLDEERMADVMLPVMSAVHAAHRRGIIHRDLKPDNILVRATRGGSLEPKLLDFGISRIDSPGDVRLTKTRDLVGTPLYMSPEQVQGGRTVDALSDQYALGIILFELASGQPPYYAEDLFPLMQAIVSGMHVPLAKFRPDLDARFVEAVERGMHKDRAERFASVADFGRALLPFASPALRESWERTLESVRPPALDSLARPATTSARKPNSSASAFEKTIASSDPSLPPAPQTSAPAASQSSVSVPPASRTHGTLVSGVVPRGRKSLLIGVAAALVLALVIIVAVRKPERDVATASAEPESAARVASAAPHAPPPAFAAPSTVTRDTPPNLAAPATPAPSASVGSTSPAHVSAPRGGRPPSSPTRPVASSPRVHGSEGAQPAPTPAPTPPKKGVNGALILE